MNNFIELVQKRRSVRRYLPNPVEREKVERCIEAARLAPSACNSQPWKFIIIDNPEIKKAAAEATFGKVIAFNHFSLQAPVMVAIVAEPANLTAGVGGVMKGIPYYLLDIGIAAEHFCFQAVEEGLGSCMIGWFDEKKLKKILDIPPSRKIALMLTLGYPEPIETPVKTRKEHDKIRSFNRY